MKRARIGWILLAALLVALVVLIAWPQPAIAPIHDPTPTAGAKVLPHTPQPLTGDGPQIVLEEGRCCAGGLAGEEITLLAQFQAPNATEMRVAPVSGCSAPTLPDDLAWEAFEPVRTFPTRLPLNWVGYALAAQFRDAQGNVSPVVCDEVSLEGSPAPEATATP